MIRREPQRVGCSAYGCPMCGTMTSGFGDRKKWWCSYHFGRDVSQYQIITAELNRVAWLSSAICDIRSYGGKSNWPVVYGKIKNSIMLAQRADLQFKGNKTETKNKWLSRLEKELEEIIKKVVSSDLPKRPPHQVSFSENHFHGAMKFASIQERQLGVVMKNEKWVMTVGEKLAMVCTLSLRDGISNTDFIDMQNLRDYFNGEPEKASIIEFDDKQIERINTIYHQFFEV